MVVPSLVAHRRFTVVARIRPGAPCGVSATEIGISIRAQL